MSKLLLINCYWKFLFIHMIHRDYYAYLSFYVDSFL